MSYNIYIYIYRYTYVHMCLYTYVTHVYRSSRREAELAGLEAPADDREVNKEAATRV